MPPAVACQASSFILESARPVYLINKVSCLINQNEINKNDWLIMDLSRRHYKKSFIQKTSNHVRNFKTLTIKVQRVRESDYRIKQWGERGRDDEGELESLGTVRVLLVTVRVLHIRFGHFPKLHFISKPISLLIKYWRPFGHSGCVLEPSKRQKFTLSELADATEITYHFTSGLSSM